ncbi:MAG TPA: UBP-type zinc finger domain-containing protein [Actinomycetota bacterium]|nr:UBP-type zinc finger domain-containing protein [Actinomycetota bacterium]
MATRTTICEHVPEQPAEPRAGACEACRSTINLRACAQCGYVGCCESQQGHNRAHALGEGHPVIRSMPITPHSFTWCYEHGAYV